MIRFFENHSLRAHHTFGTEANARYFFEFTETEDLQYLLKSEKFQSNPEVLILGGGSNLLFVSDFNGWVLYPNLPGIITVREDRNHVWVQAGAGVVWDDFVKFAVGNGWGGIENLSLIPGRVGATPVQNIGAYGQEVARVIDSVHGIDLKSGEEWEFTAEKCCFAYRDSIFKNELKGNFVVTSVVFKLEKFPELVLNYGGVAEKVKELGEPSIENVRNAIVSIRQSKLPDPAVLGNAGSFFKNPVVDANVQAQLIEKYPEMPFYESAGGRFKLSAGWLIDHCGFKGERHGDAGVHAHHALVLINYGTATGREIYNLSMEIRQAVNEKFEVELEPEVTIIL